MKKIFTLLIVTVFLFTACGKAEDVNDSTQSQEPSIEVLEEVAQESMVVQEDTASQEMNSEETDYVEERDYEETFESLPEESIEQLDDEISNNQEYDDSIKGLPNIAGEVSIVTDKDYESYMNATSSGLPLLPILFEIEVESTLTNGICVFQWMNAHESPITLTVTDPNGRVYYRNDEESYGGMYSYYLGDCVAGTYIIEGSTAITLENCWFFICDEEYYRDQILHEVSEYE